MIRDIDKQGGCNVRRERDKPDDGSAIRWKNTVLYFFTYEFVIIVFM